MSEMSGGIPPHNLDTLVTSLRDRTSAEEAKVLAKGALEMLGAGSSAEGQRTGVLANIAKHDYRIGQLEQAVISLKRWHWLFVLAGLSIVVQTGLSLWDRFAPDSKASAQPPAAHP